ncbi:DUF1707 SHOCT-like domain-containing protein [Streptomyces sp. 4N509B]|uniref:DUF1707 SHOCT-like domain-containing protein n=1 Tax=Streptomyces sp. 4N509B TaxID=3457413 RepID=UPI003FD34D92
MRMTTPEPRPRPELRASHEDREAVAERLRDAAAEGRIDIDELEERLEVALTAKTFGELAPLTADLPEPPAPEPGPPLVLKGGLHGAERVGRWEVPAKIVARGGLGGVKIDFTRVSCPWPEVEVEIYGEMAGVTVVVPEGWTVDTTGMDPGIGGLKDKTRPVTRLPGSPLIRLTGSGGMAGAVVRHPNVWERRKLRDNPTA